MSELFQRPEAPHLKLNPIHYMGVSNKEPTIYGTKLRRVLNFRKQPHFIPERKDAQHPAWIRSTSAVKLLDSPYLEPQKKVK